MQNLFDEAEKLDTRIFTADLGGNLLGYYSHKSRLIIIQKSLPSYQFRSILAHEIGHAYFGHTDTSHRSEYQADFWAAKKLITLNDYVWAEQIYEGDSAKIAEDLSVTANLINIYKQILERQHNEYTNAATGTNT